MLSSATPAVPRVCWLFSLVVQHDCLLFAPCSPPTGACSHVVAFRRISRHVRTHFRSSVFCRLRRERSSTGGQPGMMGLWTGPVAKRATRANVTVRGSIAAAATTTRGDVTKKESATRSKTTSCVCRRHRRLSVARLEKPLSPPCWSCVRFPCPAASRAGDDNSCSCSCPAPDAPPSSSPALTTAAETTWNYRKSDRSGYRGLTAGDALARRRT